MKIRYHSHQNAPWNRAFELLMTHPQGLSAYVDVVSPEKLPHDLTSHAETKVDRHDVVSVLEKHQAGPIESIKKLANSETLVVITGQQPGLGGGPLFLFYKIMTAIRLAEQLAQARGVDVIPIYCCGSDDHDWGEVNRLSLWRDGTWQRFAFQEELPGAHLFDKKFPQDLNEILKTFDLKAPRESSTFFKSGEDFATTQYSIIKTFFSKTPLVTIEPRWFRHLAVGFNRRVFELNDVIDQDLLMAGSALALAGLPQMFKAKQGAQLCFCHDDRRERLIFSNDIWGGRHHAIGRDRDVLNLIESAPDIFSPNVISRPIWMRHLFPVVVDVVGPSEAAYQLQIQGIFKHFATIAPVLFPRMTATILRPREQKKLNALKIMPWELGGEYETPIDPLLKEFIDDRMRGVEQLLANLQEKISKDYPEIDGKIKRAIQQLNRDVHRIELMVDKAQNIRDGDKKSQMNALNQWVYPEGKLQERVASPLSMIDEIGPSWINQFMSLVDPLKKQPAWVYLEGDNDGH